MTTDTHKPEDEGVSDLMIELATRGTFHEMLLQQLYFIVLSSMRDGNKVLQHMGPLLIEGMSNLGMDAAGIADSENPWLQQQRAIGKQLATSFVEDLAKQLGTKH